MFYEVNLDDETQILLEGQASGAMSKGSDGRSRFLPMDAYKNLVGVIADVSSRLGRDLEERTQGTGVDWKVEFSVRADGNGTVMLGQDPTVGQFRVTLTPRR